MPQWTASEDDLPFLKKDFIEEYKRWEAIERVDTSHMLNAVAPALQLKAMEPPTLPPAVRKNISPDKPKATAACEPFTPEKIRDRREMLRQQAAFVMERRAKENTNE